MTTFNATTGTYESKSARVIKVTTTFEIIIPESEIQDRELTTADEIGKWATRKMGREGVNVFAYNVDHETTFEEMPTLEICGNCNEYSPEDDMRDTVFGTRVCSDCKDSMGDAPEAFEVSE